VIYLGSRRFPPHSAPLNFSPSSEDMCNRHEQATNHQLSLHRAHRSPSPATGITIWQTSAKSKKKLKIPTMKNKNYNNSVHTPDRTLILGSLQLLLSPQPFRFRLFSLDQPPVPLDRQDTKNLVPRLSTLETEAKYDSQPFVDNQNFADV